MALRHRHHLSFLSATALAVGAMVWAPCALAVDFTLTDEESTQAKFGNSLVDAADSGNLSAVKALIKSGQPVDGKGEFGATALARTAYHGHQEVAAYLLSAGANPNVADMGGATPLHIAARQGNKEIAAFLVAKGAQIDAQDKEGWTPLMRAAVNERQPAAEALLSMGANVNIVNERGETALFQAVKKGSRPLVESMLNYGADRSLRNRDGKTVADIAFSTNNNDMQDVLANYEPQPTAPSGDVASLAVMPDSRTASPAVEERVTYMLQLGTFASPKDAERALRSYKDKHEELLEGLNPIVAEVSLNGGGTIMYRAQAGFIDNKAEANKRCDQFVDAHVDCFVVESAVAGVPPLPGLADAPVQENRNVPWEITQTSPSPAPDLPWASKPDAKLPSVHRETAPVSDTVQTSTIAGFSEKAPEPTFPLSPPPVESLSSLEEKAALEKVSSSDIAQPRVVQMASAKPAPAPAPAQQPASPLPPLESADDSAKLFQAGTPQPLIVNMPISGEAAAQRPHSGAEVRDLRSEIANGGIAPILPQQMAPLQATPMETAFGRIDNSSDVAVAEAIRVPLSAPDSPARAPIAERITTPSRTTNISTEWVEINSFESEEAAQTFWNTLSREEPEITSGLRMRLTKPFRQRRGGDVKLRVGPVRQQAHLEELCEHARDADMKCRVVSDVGTSISAKQPRMRLSEQDKAAPGDRPLNKAYDPMELNPQGKAYWAHLGSFTSAEEAQQIWETLAYAHPDLLHPNLYDIVKPPLSSSAEPHFRLRLGPYQTPYISAAVCETLKLRNVSIPCLPVHSW